MADGASADDQFRTAFDQAAAADPGGQIPAPSDPAAPAGSDPSAAPAVEPPAAGAGDAATPPPSAAPAEGANGDAAAPTETPAEPAPAADGQGGTEAPAAPAVTPPAPEAPAAPAAPTADDIVKGLAEALRSPPPAPEVPAAAAPEQPPIYSSEELEVLADYEKNWVDVSRAETLKRRVEYHDLLKFTFAEFHKYVQPLFDQVTAMGNTLHTGEVKAAVPDYSENLEADVTKWIDTQPAYLQTAYKQVMQSGTSDEVVDLIGRYRGSVGTAPAPAAPAATVPIPTPPAPSKTELSSAAKQAADSLAPVSAERSAVPQGEDPQDFATAFARYAATVPTD